MTTKTDAKSTIEEIIKQLSGMEPNGSAASAAMAGLMDEILGQTTVKPRDMEDDTSVPTSKIMDNVAYDQLESASDTFGDALKTLKSGRYKLEVSFFLLQRSGLPKDEIEEKMKMWTAVEKELSSAINDMTDRYRSLIMAIGTL